MYSILKAVINAGNASVEVMTHKVEVAWANGSITDEQKQELDDLIFARKNPQTESPTLAELYNRLSAKFDTLTDEVSDLKNRVAKLESGEGETTEPEEPQDKPVKIPKWEAWDGISDKYQTGAVVEHSGKYWQNVLEGMQNTWEPGATGVDERYWKEITKEEAEALLKEQEEQGLEQEQEA